MSEQPAKTLDAPTHHPVGTADGLRMVGTTSADPVGGAPVTAVQVDGAALWVLTSATCGGSPTATLKWSPASNRAWLGHASARMATWCSSAATKPASGALAGDRFEEVASFQDAPAR